MSDILRGLALALKSAGAGIEGFQGAQQYNQNFALSQLGRALQMAQMQQQQEQFDVTQKFREEQANWGKTWERFKFQHGGAAEALERKAAREWRAGESEKARAWEESEAEKNRKWRTGLAKPDPTQTFMALLGMTPEAVDFQQLTPLQRMQMAQQMFQGLQGMGLGGGYAFGPWKGPYSPQTALPAPSGGGGMTTPAPTKTGLPFSNLPTFTTTSTGTTGRGFDRGESIPEIPDLSSMPTEKLIELRKWLIGIQ